MFIKFVTNRPKLIPFFAVFSKTFSLCPNDARDSNKPELCFISSHFRIKSSHFRLIFIIQSSHSYGNFGEIFSLLSRPYISKSMRGVLETTWSMTTSYVYSWIL